MSKKTRKSSSRCRVRNIVAKHAHIHKGVVFRDRTVYRRREKHQVSDSFPMLMPNLAWAW
ncbi:DUF7230 family protein [Methyloterricola oryzae]|uniref:DUF7230 family protein n=1 Tax=Methyloterricola oryzae TaxID=1495050 RepID=UPI003F6A4495